MLGGNYEHLEIDSAFLQWVKNDRKLNDDEVVLEWIDENPFFHNDPRYAPVGKYMFSGLEKSLMFESRANAC